MKQGKTRLTENHRRSLTSALVMVEQMLIEVADFMIDKKNACSFEIKDDISIEDKNHNLKITGEALEQICKLAEKYETNKSHQSLRKIINAKKTRIWEILSDMRSKKQKGFGEFPKELVKEYDNDIDSLMIITDNIKF